MYLRFTEILPACSWNDLDVTIFLIGLHLCLIKNKNNNNNLFLCRQKVCCGIIYKGRFGEVLIDPHLFKPCCRKKQRQQQQQQQQREEEEEEEEDEDEEDEEEVEVEEAVGVAEQKSQTEEDGKETTACQENPKTADLRDPIVALPDDSTVAVEAAW